MGSKREPSFESKHCTLTGLYPSCKWDQKVIKKLICDKRMSPIFKGTETKENEEDEECPVCFLFYPKGLNRTKCCKHSLCTECFLQVREPGGGNGSQCPFCNEDRLSIIYSGPLSKDERIRRDTVKKKKYFLSYYMNECIYYFSLSLFFLFSLSLFFF